MAAAARGRRGGPRGGAGSSWPNLPSCFTPFPPAASRHRSCRLIVLCSLSGTFESLPEIRQAVLISDLYCSLLVPYHISCPTSGLGLCLTKAQRIWSRLITSIEIQECQETKGRLFALLLDESKAHGLSWVSFRSKPQVAIPHPPSISASCTGEKNTWPPLT